MKKEKIRFSLITIIITLFLGLLANQLVQPFVFPRISDYDMTPLYIQSMADPSKVDYHVVSKISYIIDVPMFNSNSEIDLMLINEKIYGSSNIKLMCDIQEPNPYVELDYIICGHSSFKKIKDIGAKMKAKIIPDGFDLRKVEAVVYVEEKLNFVREASAFRDEPVWWSVSMTYPSGIKRDLVSVGTQVLGVGITGKNNISYTFSELVVKNVADLPIRGYKAKVNLNPEAYNRVCYDGMPWDEEEIKGDKYISINLKEGETKRFLIIDKASEFYSREEDIIKFRFKRHNFCSDGWLKYKEYLKE